MRTTLFVYKVPSFLIDVERIVTFIKDQASADTIGARPSGEVSENDFGEEVRLPMVAQKETL